MLFNQRYQEGQFRPQRGGEHNWHVWCCAGALEVLRSGEYVRYLAEHPGEDYTINFANNASAFIQPGHPLWEVLREVAKSYSVEVFQLTLRGGYLPWTGADTDVRAFDCVRVSNQEQHGMPRAQISHGAAHEEGVQS